MSDFTRSRSSARNSSHSVRMRHRVRAVERFVDAGAEGEIFKKLLRLVHGRGIVGLHARALLLERRNDVERGRLAHVVGVRLEGRGPERRLSCRARSRRRRLDLARPWPACARSLTATTASTMRSRRAGVLRGAAPAPAYPWESRSRHSRARHAGISSRCGGRGRCRARLPARSAPTLLAEIRHLVDEGDLGREKGVRGVFDQFRRRAIGEDAAAFR